MVSILALRALDRNKV